MLRSYSQKTPTINLFHLFIFNIIEIYNKSIKQNEIFIMFSQERVFTSFLLFGDAKTQSSDKLPRIEPFQSEEYVELKRESAIKERLHQKDVHW
jgi:hypothetical protein